MSSSSVSRFQCALCPFVNDQEPLQSVTLKDFIPCSRWVYGKELKEELYAKNNTVTLNSKITSHIDALPNVKAFDLSTGRAYSDDDKLTLRVKFLAITLFGFLIITVPATILNIALRLVLILSLYHFWRHTAEVWDYDGSYDLKERLICLAKDLCRVVLAPVLLLGILLSGIYGIVSPLNGRKLFGSFERFTYGTPVAAPCMQPGDPGNKKTPTEILAEIENMSKSPVCNQVSQLQRRK